MRASRSRPIKRRPLFARPGLSPATKPACGLKGPTLIIGFPLQGCGGASARLFTRRPCRERDDGRACAERLDFGSLCWAAKAWRTAFALEHGFDDLPLRFKLWFGKAFDLARDIANFAASTIVSKKRALERQLTALLSHASCKPKSRERETSF